MGAQNGMTSHVPDAKTLESARQHFETYLRSKDLKLTNQRLEVLQRVAKIDGHFTADDLVASFRPGKSKPSKATIYRTLTLLKECDVLDEHAFHASASHVYEFAWGRPHHDHLICLSCASIIEFYSQKIEDLQDDVAASHGFHPKFHSQKIYGICRNCWKRGVHAV